MTRRRNILFLTHRVPFPPNKGDKIRTFHQLDHLASRHNVYCACFVDRPEDPVHAIALGSLCAGVIAVPWDRRVGRHRAAVALLEGRSLTCAAYDDPAMWDQLRDLSREVQFDAVVAFSACMAPYAWRFPVKRRVLDLCDVDSRKWLDYATTSRFPVSAGYLTEARRLASFEGRCIGHFDAVLLATERERSLLDTHGRHKTLHVVPNGVDLPAAITEPPSSADPVVTFVGAMDYRPNVDGVDWFVRRAWPSVKLAAPDARFMIVGANPAPRIRRLARRPGVIVTGEVPSVQPYLKSSRVVIAPMPIVRGIPNKVLEAMAFARPVVGTPAVADALDANPDTHLVTADSPASFARGVSSLLCRDAFCDQLGTAGHQFVSEFYRWPEILERFERIVLADRATPIHRTAFPSLAYRYTTQGRVAGVL